jgi:hypothetical protein
MATRTLRPRVHKLAGFAWSLLLASILLAGCHDDFNLTSRCDFCGPSLGFYSIPTAPESLINNIQVSYRQREIGGYAKTLAPEFKFQFQPIDANVIGKQFWTHDEDSTGTRALLRTTEVSEIRINLYYQKRDTLDVSAPIDSLKIRIVTTDLQVDQTDGTTWVVTDQQDMFFRKGLAALGENPNYWWLYEWDDLPSVYSPRSEFTSHTMGVGLTTWGKLKTLYAR